MDWPADGSPAVAEDLVEALCHAMRFAYHLQRRNTSRDIPWKGPDIGQEEQVGSPSAVEQLRAANLAYSENDQGRDALTEIMLLALRLGIEQGRRIFKQSPEYQVLLLKAAMPR